ncbi:MAG: hypothetical protein M1831_004974 [Alyxoria varia]|nr:MAG: hypothetical protein M1831_004974 [Alyxoria varia]
MNSTVQSQHGENIYSREYAQSRDQQDRLRHLRDQFIIPTRADLKRKSLARQHGQQKEFAGADDDESQECTYLCGNSLGLQPKTLQKYVSAQLSLWGSKGVYGHFKEVKDSPIPPWVHIDEAVQAPMARIVGADTSEVAVMGTLTANLHLLLASFYRPKERRRKIIIEGQAFPSDHFAVESQIRHHGLDPDDAMVLLKPTERSSGDPAVRQPPLPTEMILAIIDEHAEETAVVLLPGIQYYTGQLFEMERITAHAQSKGIVVGWDLAHAVGNVPMHLHDWNVDFAVWCSYKYLNAGPGAIGGLFVHSKYTADPSLPDGVESIANGDAEKYHPRLAGWWGSSKTSRFAMDNVFSPTAGAAGFQVSNPSALDMSAMLATLSVFDQTTMSELRDKSIALTGYLENLLETLHRSHQAPYSIITPQLPCWRGAQLSVRMKHGLLDHVVKALDKEGVVVDERRPDVIRVAPAPLYNTFEDCRMFMDVFSKACREPVDT